MDGRAIFDSSSRQLMRPSPLLLKVSGNSVDPFRTAPVILDHDTTNILQFYVRVLEPTVSGHWRPGTKVPTTTLQHCFRDKLRMQGLLTEAASYMEHAARLEGSSGKAQVFIYNCVQAVNHYIQSQGVASSALVFAALHLCGAEDMRNNLDASMVHLRGARDIIGKCFICTCHERRPWLGLCHNPGCRAVLEEGHYEQNLIDNTSLSPCQD